MVLARICIHDMTESNTYKKLPYLSIHLYSLDSLYSRGIKKPSIVPGSSFPNSPQKHLHRGKNLH